MHLVQRTCSSSKKRKAAEILEQFDDEEQESRREANTSRNSESHVREKAPWLNEYYTRATTKRGSKASLSSAEEEKANYPDEETFDDGESSYAVEYMYKKFHEEQNAVQLLMYLKYSQTNPEVFLTRQLIWGSQLPHFHASYFVPHSTSQQFSNSSLCRCLSCQAVSYSHVESQI